MKSVVFVDSEINQNDEIFDLGAVKLNGEKLHTADKIAFSNFVTGSEYVGGHNILKHDLKYISDLIVGEYKVIDTLCLSPLLFPNRPYHHLVKDYKLNSDDLNNPLSDAEISLKLFYDEQNSFNELDENMQKILFLLLGDKREFSGFFEYAGYCENGDAEQILRDYFADKICSNADISSLINNSPIELAYCLALISTNDRYSIIPHWVHKNYPAVESVMKKIRGVSCENCRYCNSAHALLPNLKRYFGYDKFRCYNGEPLQENAAKAAVNNKSLIAVFPTGGGKSVTFQLPALMAGESCRGLTIVISPLQSLMKDQVDNLIAKGISDAVTINGMLDPIERAQALKNVESGLASILYISPESLRSNTIEKLLLERHISRFVIDEAHCFSAWGQDFRVDYLYIGDFIKELQEKKHLAEPIPVSCFTATAKPKVISDIRDYFRGKLGVEMDIYATGASRQNLRYEVLYMDNDEAIQQIHIIGEYANMMTRDSKTALQFVLDYFGMDYKQFIAKYFAERSSEIERNITPDKYNKIFGCLSERQLEIINDKSKYIVVAAGPGSGKTMVLVRKLASLYQMEDTKHEQMLMLTFSRAAATEFKNRLTELLGGAARYIDIKTFHSYCFDITGRVGSLESSFDIVQKAADLIRSGEIEQGQITKTVVVIDEAQDMDSHEFDFIKALMEHNEDMRVIAVGDDDQNIFEFRNSSSEHMKSLITNFGANKYSMLDNYRSSRAVVNFANEYAERIPNRLKNEPIRAVKCDLGLVKLIKHSCKNMEIPIVDCLQKTWNNEHETAAILTFTNDEALSMLGILNKRNIPARLIQSGNGFRMAHLAEVKYFCKKLEINDKNLSGTISKTKWEQAKIQLQNKYADSTCLETVINMLSEFEKMNSETMYSSDFKMLIFESDYDTFCPSAKNAVTISTIHKAKGREFDNVYLMLNNVDDKDDAVRRRIYVAISRAKKNLYIHYNNSLFDNITAEEAQLERDENLYPEPNELAMHLGLHDVILDFFINRKELVFKLKSGDELQIRDDALFSGNKKVVAFSNGTKIRIEKLCKKGYTPIRAEIAFIVEWVKKNTKESAAVILPNIYFKKN